MRPKPSASAEKRINTRVGYEMLKEGKSQSLELTEGLQTQGDAACEKAARGYHFSAPRRRSVLKGKRTFSCGGLISTDQAGAGWKERVARRGGHEAKKTKRRMWENTEKLKTNKGKESKREDSGNRTGQS